MKNYFEKRIENLEKSESYGVLIFVLVPKGEKIPKTKFTGAGHYTEDKKGKRKHYIEGQLVPYEVLRNVVCIYDDIPRPKERNPNRNDYPYVAENNCNKKFEEKKNDE